MEMPIIKVGTGQTASRLALDQRATDKGEGGYRLRAQREPKKRFKKHSTLGQVFFEGYLQYSVRLILK